jgi:DICT domain-containing protein
MPLSPDFLPALSQFSFDALIDQRQRTIHSRRLMLALSYVIEDTAGSAPSTTLIASFQRYSLARPQLERYTQITAQLDHTYIIGVPDADLPALPRTTLLPISQDSSLMHEWVVLAIGPTCHVGLVARDLTAQQPAQRSHQFQGSWTTDPVVLSTVWAAFFTALGQPQPPVAYDTRASAQTASRARQLLQERMRSIR